MSSDEKLERDGRSLTAVLLIAILAFPLGYAVLLGPAAWLHQQLPTGHPIQNSLEVIYAPLEWLDRQLPGRPFSKYVELWE